MSATTTTPTTKNRPLRALVLDDDAVVVRLLETSLRPQGYEVRSSGNGVEGVAVLLDELLVLDVLVVDLDLPGRDGWSLLRLIRDAGGERDLPIVVLANGTSSAVRAQLRSLGADAVVERSGGPAAVARAVDAVLATPPSPARMRTTLDAIASLLVPVAIPA